MKSITIDGVDYDLVPRKKEEVPPPGIKSFLAILQSGLRKELLYYPEAWDGSGGYESWAKTWLNPKENVAIHSIEASGNIWTVGEKVKMEYDTFRIDKFTWEPSADTWRVRVTDLDEDDPIIPTAFWIGNLSKLPPKPKPVVTLAGVPLYNGDKYWMVEKGSFHLSEMKIVEDFSGVHLIKYWEYPFYVCFPTKELAEKFVLDNKPVIPYGELKDCWNTGLVNALLEKYKPKK